MVLIGSNYNHGKLAKGHTPAGKSRGFRGESPGIVVAGGEREVSLNL